MDSTLHEIVPWGRAFAEYERMFALAPEDLEKRILGAGDGPASFNAEASLRDCCIVSCDPLYQSSAAEIRKRIEETYPLVMQQTRDHAETYIWGRGIDSIEDLGMRRMSAMTLFLQDFERGQAAGRYQAMALPKLDFADGEFDLALCSHFLFLYSDRLDAGFHVEAVAEMMRVAEEARIFPLLDMLGHPSPHVEPVRREMTAKGFAVSIEEVPYEFQKGGNQMMRVRRP